MDVGDRPRTGGGRVGNLFRQIEFRSGVFFAQLAGGKEGSSDEEEEGYGCILVYKVYKVYKVHKVLWTPAGRFVHGSEGCR